MSGKISLTLYDLFYININQRTIWRPKQTTISRIIFTELISSIIIVAITFSTITFTTNKYVSSSAHSRSSKTSGLKKNYLNFVKYILNEILKLYLKNNKDWCRISTTRRKTASISWPSWCTSSTIPKFFRNYVNVCTHTYSKSKLSHTYTAATTTTTSI